MKKRKQLQKKRITEKGEVKKQVFIRCFNTNYNYKFIL